MKFTRVRYQQGSLIREERKVGPDVWIFRWRQRTPDGHARLDADQAPSTSPRGKILIGPKWPHAGNVCCCKCLKAQCRRVAQLVRALP